MKSRYQCLPGRNVKGNVNLIGECLAKIAARNGGAISPHKVVEEAKPKTSPLHNNFDWDDKSAAQKHRLWQARHLIGSIVEINVHTEKPVRSFVNITTMTDDDGDITRERSYAPIEDAMSDPELRKRVLGMVKRQMNTILASYKDYPVHRPCFRCIWPRGIDARKI
jgi:hypothetical protein